MSVQARLGSCGGSSPLGWLQSERLRMQILLGLGHLGQILHTEVLSPLDPARLLSLARLRAWHFPRIEVWEESVCVLRLPPCQAR